MAYCQPRGIFIKTQVPLHKKMSIGFSTFLLASCKYGLISYHCIESRQKTKDGGHNQVKGTEAPEEDFHSHLKAQFPAILNRNFTPVIHFPFTPITLKHLVGYLSGHFCPA